MSFEITNLADQLNHLSMEGYLPANDRAKVAETCRSLNRPEFLAALTKSILIPKGMTIDQFNNLLERYPNIREIDLSKAREITPEMIDAYHQDFVVTRTPIFSCSEKISNILESYKFTIEQAAQVGMSSIGALGLVWQLFVGDMLLSQDIEKIAWGFEESAFGLYHRPITNYEIVHPTGSFVKIATVAGLLITLGTKTIIERTTGATSNEALGAGAKKVAKIGLVAALVTGLAIGVRFGAAVEEKALPYIGTELALRIAEFRLAVAEQVGLEEVITSRIAAVTGLELTRIGIRIAAAKIGIVVAKKVAIAAVIPGLFLAELGSVKTRVGSAVNRVIGWLRS